MRQTPLEETTKAEIANHCNTGNDFQMPAANTVGSGRPQSPQSGLPHINDCTNLDSIGKNDTPKRQGEPIAIVGMGCRLPGNVASPEELWDLLINGGSGQSSVPKTRYKAESFYHENTDRPGSINSHGGYFIQEDVRHFENGFFGINNLEATYMDAQQRKLLEVAFEAFESAGMTLEELSGQNIGCYVGNFTTDFHTIQYKDAEYLSRYSAGGLAPSILANRLSHTFNLQGPSVVLDTACSSSLYGLHVACTALDAGECDAALVASANLIQSPEQQILATKAGILSKSATCHTFDSSADGYGRSEGVGALLLKRLGDAKRDKTPIRSIIRGTAVNSNGKTNGITLPDAQGQENVIRKAYARAGIPLDQTDYIEAHGTGTPVGDPIEIQGISNAFKHSTGRPTFVGSVKTNLGHSEAASGISSVMKVALALEMGRIPPTIGIQTINPHLLTSERNIHIVTDEMVWPATTHRRAGVNSFGFGGANSHVIMESPDSCSLPNGIDENEGLLATNLKQHVLLQVSAHSEKSLRARIDDLHTSKLCDDSTNLDSLIYTLAEHRTSMKYRGFIVLEPGSVSTQMSSDNLQYSSEMRNRQVAFAFTGQGAQWPGMARELIGQYPIFRDSIATMDQYLLNIPNGPSWTLSTVLAEDNGSLDVINSPLYSQTLCTAVQISLVDLLRHWGIVPRAVIGHSSGEIAAAYAANHITKREAVLIAYYRGFAVSGSSKNGAMLAVGWDFPHVTSLIQNLKALGRVQVACINSPTNVTLSGDAHAIDAAKNALEQQSVFVRRLRTGGKAYHSDHMLEVGSSYQDYIATVLQDAPKIQSLCQSENGADMISTVNCEKIDASSTRNPKYWRSNLENRVQFSDGLTKMLTQQDYQILEIGPHPALQIPIKETRTALKPKFGSDFYACTLTRGRNTVVTMLELAGHMFLRGISLNLSNVNLIPESKKQIIPNIPKYRWNYDSQTLWQEPRSSSDFRERSYPRHDLLGSLIPGGNGIAISWRNLLSTRDVPWLRDHKFGPTILFPAAAYIVMATEAICQAQGLNPLSCPGVSLRSVKFLNALPLDDGGERTEIFTELRRLEISNATRSSHWWRYQISSFSSGSSTEHATGLIRLSTSGTTPLSKVDIVENVMEPQPTKIWYDRFTNCGMNWGPSFNVMKKIYVDRTRQCHQAISNTSLLQGEVQPLSNQPQYIVHPISVDAMFQTAFVASTAGLPKELLTRIPVSISEIQISSLKGVEKSDRWTIGARTETVGFGTVRIDSDLRNSDDQVLVHITGARAIAYHGTESTPSASRTPMLRIHWKPDLGLITASEQDNLASYVENFASEITQHYSTEEKLLSGFLDLLTHQEPNLKILLVSATSPRNPALFLETLGGEHLLRRHRRLSNGTIDASCKITGYDVVSSGHSSSVEAHDYKLGLDLIDFDLVVICSDEHDQLPSCLPQLLQKLSPHARALFPITEDMERESYIMEHSLLRIRTNQLGCAAIAGPKDHVFVKSWEAQTSKLLIVGQNIDSPFNTALREYLCSQLETNVELITLAEVSPTTVPSRSSIIMTCEIEKPLLATMSAEEMSNIRHITNNAKMLLWITCPDLLHGGNPDLLLVNGFSRAVMAEQPALRFCTLCLDSTTQIKPTVSNIKKVCLQILDSDKKDLEFVQKDGLLHTSRWLRERTLNERFEAKHEAEVVRLSLEDLCHGHLSIRSAGQLDTIHFVQDSSTEYLLQPGEVEVQVKSVGLNAKDFYVLGARIDTKACSSSCEFSGVVHRVRPDSTLKLGDRVVCMLPGSFSTYETVPEWACCKLQDDEEFGVASTIPLAFSTALYALKFRANLQEGESVLIHSGSGGVGIAAIQIAKLCRAEIFVTVGTDTKKEFLIQEFGLRSDHIFSSRDSSFLDGVLSATSGDGVDVVLNSLTGDLLHDSFRACAQFGRFIEIGKKDIIESGRLEMDNFSRNVSFIAFDLSDLFHSKREAHKKIYRKIYSNLLNESMHLLRTGKIKPVEPLKTFDASEVTEAFRYFGKASRIGKVCVSFENPSSLLPALPTRFSAKFVADKTYIMVGCLGGIGRSLTRWMFGQGARSFVMLGRSATDKRSAAELVQDLRALGADVRVVRGDVSNLIDVHKALSAAPSPIGGVVQASMYLHEELWSSMSHSGWHDGIRAKFTGTWNLHNVLQSSSTTASALDFFLMLSSISGTIGNATQSNYCAANAFLDNFARHRRAQGLPAISIGLGMIAEVGYLHEHPEVAQALARKGMQAITEDEMLLIIDLALTYPTSGDTHNDPLLSSHLLTGCEITGFKELMDQGFEGFIPVLDDPRAGVLAAALARENNNQVAIGQANGSKMPQEIRQALQEGNSLRDAVERALAVKMSNLILLPVEQLRPESPLAELGLDSMIAAEFRGFLFQTMEIDVPFMTLLGKTTSVRSLAEIVMEKLQGEEGENRVVNVEG